MRKWILSGISEADTNYFNIGIGRYDDGDSNFGYNADPNDSNNNKFFGSLSSTRFYGSTILSLYARRYRDYTSDGYLRWEIQHYFTVASNIGISSTLYIKRLDTNVTVALNKISMSYRGEASWYVVISNQTTDSRLLFRDSDVGKNISIYVGFENPS